MIAVLGARRVIILATLVAVNAILALATYYYIIPQKTKTDSQLRTVKTEITKRRNEIAQMQTQIQQIEEQKALFETLKQSGFFGEQDRYQARKTIAAIQTESRVLSARYTIGAAGQVDSDLTTQAGQQMMVSPVKIDLAAIDDIDIYSFLYWIENAFPGHAAIDGMTLKRNTELNEAALRQIGTGTPVIMVSGTVDFTWRTMVPKAAQEATP